VLNAGKVEQFGAPVELFQRPANKFVASFIGSPRMNIYAGKLVGRGPAGATVEVPGFGRIELPIDPGALEIGAPIELGIRHPGSVRKLVIASAFYTRDAVSPEFWKGFDNPRWSPESS